MPTLTTASSLKNATLETSVRRTSRQTKIMQSYQTDQQLKYLHLEAEVEVLLQHLQTLKQRQQISEN